MTDKDAALKCAIQEVYPNSIHRLCKWPSATDEDVERKRVYSERFKKLLYSVHCPSQFKDDFEGLLIDLSDHPDLVKYLQDKHYPCRHKWAAAFTDHVFTMGVQATTVVESAHASVKRRLDGPNSTLVSVWEAIKDHVDQQLESITREFEMQAARLVDVSEDEPMFALICHHVSEHAMNYMLEMTKKKR